MKTFATALLVTTLGLAPALAQTAAAPAPAPSAPAASAPAPVAPSTSDYTKDGKLRMKVVRAQCREAIKADTLKGDARKQAMAACIVKTRPDLAARVKCQMDPQVKGMAKDARKAFVKDCVAKTKG